MKYLGMVVDRKLNCIGEQIKVFWTDWLRKLDLFKCISRTSWGSDRTNMLRVYRAIITSMLDYGCFLYGTAAHSSYTEAYRYSSVASLYAFISPQGLDYSYPRKDSSSALRSYLADHMSQFPRFCIHTDGSKSKCVLCCQPGGGGGGAVNKCNCWQRALYSQPNCVECSLLTKCVETPLLSSATLVMPYRWLNTMTPYTHWYTEWFIGYIDFTYMGRLFLFAAAHPRQRNYLYTG